MIFLLYIDYFNRKERYINENKVHYYNKKTKHKKGGKKLLKYKKNLMMKNLPLSDEELHKRKCIECGKTMSLLEGYRHPTLGPHFLLCKGCFEKVESSVERWERFVLFNSFNPESPDPTFIELPFLNQNKIKRQKKTKHN